MFLLVTSTTEEDWWLRECEMNATSPTATATTNARTPMVTILEFFMAILLRKDAGESQSASRRAPDGQGNLWAVRLVVVALVFVLAILATALVGAFEGSGQFPE